MLLLSPAVTLSSVVSVLKSLSFKCWMLFILKANIDDLHSALGTILFRMELVTDGWLVAWLTFPQYLEQGGCAVSWAVASVTQRELQEVVTHTEGIKTGLRTSWLSNFIPRPRSVSWESPASFFCLKLKREFWSVYSHHLPAADYIKLFQNAAENCRMPFCRYWTKGRLLPGARDCSIY